MSTSAILLSRLNSQIKASLRDITTGKLKTFAPFVRLLHLSGKPMTLDKHYQMLPMFNVRMPRKSLFMLARQLGKSTTMSADTIIRSSFLPYFHTLVLQPRFDQIQRFNASVFQPMIKMSPFKSFISPAELSRMSMKTFENNSMVLMDFCYVSADRLRGIANIAVCKGDELQDVDRAFIPVIKETMSASLLWGFFVGTGTPKTTDTTLGLEWAQSSQAEWVIPCSCGYFNIPHPEHDLMKMIGKHGCICAKCGKALNPVFGTYVHARPELALVYPGYHVSQVVHPLHCMDASGRKWPILLDKMREYSEMMFYNEVLGYPYDVSVVPLTLMDILNARNEYRWKSFLDIPQNLRTKYQCITIGLDFDGGGALSDSFTALSVQGLRRKSDTIDCLYRERIPKTGKKSDVCAYIAEWVQRLKPDMVAYDAAGAGFLYREMMVQQGVNPNVLMPYKYSAPGAGDIIKFHEGLRDDGSMFYSIDKSRSLAVLIETVKNGRTTVPWFEDTEVDWKTNPTMDLLALIENPIITRSNDAIYLIGRKSGIPDDFSHAFNFGCASIWDRYKSYPKLGQRYQTDELDIRNSGLDKDLYEEDESVWQNPDMYDIFESGIDNSDSFYNSPGGF